jgi:chitodextrinase
VIAEDANGNQSTPATISVTTLPGTGDTDPPSVPTGLIVDSATVSAVDISWNASTDTQGVVASYRIFRDGTEVGTSTTTSFTDTTVQANKTYQYTVSAIDDAGNESNPSATLQVITPPSTDTEAPSIPTELTLNSVSANAVSFSWTASTDTQGTVDLYHIMRDGTEVGTSSVASYTDSTVAADTAYVYNVTAEDNANNESAISADLNVDTSVSNSAPQIISGQIAFTKQVIDNAVNEVHFVLAADLNGDNFIDIVATDFVDDSVFWYQNDGNGGFVTRILDSNLDGAYPAHVGDVDLDGDIDVLAAGYKADTFVWYENDGIGGFTRHDIDTASDGAHSIVTVDIDQDGDVDLLTSSQDAGTIAWYENDGANNFSRHIIDTTATAAKRADFADVDGDGDIDVITASFAVDEIAWLENDGNEGFTKRIISTTADGAYFVSPVDVDGDGDIDVMTASQRDNTFAWYENNGTGGFTEHIIDASASGARTIIGTDIDGDGDIDALGASRNNDTIAWYINDGNGVFTKQGIDLAADGAYGIFPIDIDSDGDTDVLSGSRDSNEVALHTQIRTHLETVLEGGTIVINETILLTVDADNAPQDLRYTITDAPLAGQLQLGGSSVLSGGTFTQDDINNDRVTYVHDGTNSVTDEFSFTVEDVNGSGSQSLASTFTINVADVGDNIVELPLDEGTGSVAMDISGINNNGSLINGAVFEAITGDGSTSSVRFDGVNAFINLGSVDVNGSGLTLAAWFNADSYSGAGRDPRIISKASGIASNDHIFMIGTVASGSDTRLRARVKINGTTITLIASSGNLGTSLWYHAAVTYDGLTLKLYLDGVEVASQPRLGTVNMDPLIPVTIGSQPPGAGGRYFDGLLDDVRILQRAMSVGEIASLAGN